MARRGLPREVTVNGRPFAIRWDYEDILYILETFSLPEFTKNEMADIALKVFYPDWKDLRLTDISEAVKQMQWFIAGGYENRKRGPEIKVVDWQQDAPLLYPAINKVAGYEVRQTESLHWWTFLGYFMEISEGTYATVLALRTKKARGKRLEDWEKEYWKSNRDICQLHARLTREEEAEKERLNRMLR